MFRIRFLFGFLAIAFITACSGARDSSGAGNGLPMLPSGAKPSAQTTTTYKFQGPPTDAGGPFGALLLGSDGNLYGTSNEGGIGSLDDGSVFEVTPSGTERVIYTFLGGADGAGVEAGLTAGSGGVLYGATDYGGGASACNGGCGTVYELVPNGSNYSERILYAFQGGSDGATPIASVLVDGSGNIWGASHSGGGGPCTSTTNVTGCGTVFELTPNGSSYTERVVHAFQGGSDGAYPADSLIMDGSGRLYGTTQFGGGTSCDISPNPQGCGIVFAITPTGREVVLYHFRGGSADGNTPRSALLFLKKAQRLVGTTVHGGSTGCGGSGCGTVFELTRGSREYTEKLLYSFGGYSGDGISPSDQNGVVADAHGDIFGTTVSGGSSFGRGAVFELSPSGPGYTEKIVHSFEGGDGAYPHASVTMDASGQLYGVAFDGGLHVHGCGYSCGTVYKIVP